MECRTRSSPFAALGQSLLFKLKFKYHEYLRDLPNTSSLSLTQQLELCHLPAPHKTRLDHEQLSVGYWKAGSNRMSYLQVNQTLERVVVDPSASQRLCSYHLILEFDVHIVSRRDLHAWNVAEPEDLATATFPCRLIEPQYRLRHPKKDLPVLVFSPPT